MEPYSTSNSNGVDSQPGKVAVVCVPATTVPKTYDNFPYRQAFLLGIGQIIAGGIILTFGSVSFAYAMVYELYFLGHGIVSGMLFIITGAFGLDVDKKKTKCRVVTYLVLCVVSIAVAIAIIPPSIIQAVRASKFDKNYCTGLTSHTASPSLCSAMSVENAMEVCIAIAAICEVILGISGTVLFRNLGTGCCSVPQQQASLTRQTQSDATARDSFHSLGSSGPSKHRASPERSSEVMSADEVDAGSSSRRSSVRTRSESSGVNHTIQSRSLHRLGL